MKRILITGATGLVGRRLVRRFERVSITTRDPDRAADQFEDREVQAIVWNPIAEPLSLTPDQPFDVVINLMGEPIASSRWNPAKKKKIVDSRVVGTQRLVAAIGRMKRKPELMISASAVGYYGDRGSQLLSEQVGPGEGFLSETCSMWEDAAKKIQSFGIRLAIVRLGVVLASDGGALSQMLPVFKWGLGGRLGSGLQYMSWIHIDDLVSLFCWIVANQPERTVYNAVAPEPVTNREFTRQLAAILNRPAVLPVPGRALRWVIGEFAENLLFSQRAVPTAALEGGFEFCHGDLAASLKDLLT